MRLYADILADLEQPYDGPTFEKDGKTYIPWNEAVKVANAVFGPDGYDIQVLVQPHIEGAGYTATVRVTVFPEGGRAFYRDGVGFTDLLTTKGGQEMTDMAIKGAVSDALNRALKLFGPRFGLNLYDKAQSGAARTGSGQPSYSGGGSGGGKLASPKQVEWLVKKGIAATEEEAAQWTAARASAALDAAFNGNSSGGNGRSSSTGRAQRTTGRTAMADEDDADIPF